MTTQRAAARRLGRVFTRPNACWSCNGSTRPTPPNLDLRVHTPNMSSVKMTEQYLEDFAVGQVYRSGRLSVEKDQIIAFAGQFDPQPYHLDEQAARKSVFGGLAASGWHTAALSMRLLVDSE